MEDLNMRRYFEKNDLIIQKLMLPSLNKKGEFRPRSFFKAVTDIQKSFNIYDKLESVPIQGLEFTEKEKISEVDKLVTAFLKSLEETRFKKFLQKVEALRKKYGLGEEWSACLKRLIITQVISAPKISVITQKDSDKKSLHFIVGPNTTKEELDTAWQISEKKRKSLFGSTRVRLATKKSVNNFLETIEITLAEFKQENTTEEYKLKKIDIVAGMEPSGEDNDYFPSEEEDRRKLNRLKTRQSRLKK